MCIYIIDIYAGAHYIRNLFVKLLLNKSWNISQQWTEMLDHLETSSNSESLHIVVIVLAGKKKFLVLCHVILLGWRSLSKFKLSIVQVTQPLLEAISQSILWILNTPKLIFRLRKISAFERMANSIYKSNRIMNSLSTKQQEIFS